MKKIFNELGIKEELVEALSKQNITNPTEVQEKIIPLIAENKDILAQSATGTGKTLAYLLPLIEKIDTSKKEMQVIILTPTHELAVQVHNQVQLIKNNSGIPITSIALTGNANITKQVEKLRDKQHIVIGAPVRILKLIQMKKITAHTIKTIVIDEFDKLLHKDYINDIKAIIKTTLRDRQLLFLSASSSKESVEMAQEISKELTILTLAGESPLNDAISHYYIVTELRDKMEMLRKVIHAAEPKKAIIFINKSYDIEKTVEKLKYHNLSVEGIHGSDDKQVRKNILENFRNGKVKILVASDVVARGLDVEDVTHIINLEMPESSKDYLHRAGRTGRAGKTGVTITLITNKNQEQAMNKLGKELKIEVTQKTLAKGEIIDIGI